MQNEEHSSPNISDQVALIIAGIFFFFQIFTFIYYYNFVGIDIIRWVGWFLLAIGFLFSTLSISSLKKYGAPAEGKTWVYSTVIVQQSVYGIIRHPFSLGWCMMAIAFAFVSQTWLNIYCMIIQIPLIIFDVICEEDWNLRRFGSDYISYQTRVPMMNVFTGIARYQNQKSVSGFNDN